MNRRQLLGACAVALAAPGRSPLAAGASHVEYSRPAFDRALRSGKPFLLDFYASW